MRLGGPVVPLVSISTATSAPASRRGRRCAGGAGHDRCRAEVVDRDHRGCRGRLDQFRQIVGGADDAAQPESGDLVPGPFDPALGVDGDDATVGAEHPEEAPDVGGSVAQDDADPFARRGDRCGDGIDRGAERSPGGPTALELDRRRSGIDRDDLRDARGERRGRDSVGVRTSGHHRTSGSRRAGGWAATSAIPAGFARRV